VQQDQDWTPLIGNDEVEPAHGSTTRGIKAPLARLIRRSRIRAPRRKAADVTA